MDEIEVVRSRLSAWQTMVKAVSGSISGASGQGDEGAEAGEISLAEYVYPFTEEGTAEIERRREEARELLES